MADFDALNKIRDLTPDQCDKLDVLLKDKGGALGKMDSGLSLDELESVVGGDEPIDPLVDLLKEGAQVWVEIARVISTGICPGCNEQIGPPPLDMKTILNHVSIKHS